MTASVFERETGSATSSRTTWLKGWASIQKGPAQAESLKDL
jgi:hypothetical protein